MILMSHIHIANHANGLIGIGAILIAVALISIAFNPRN
jgi:hypothetical protein